MIQVNILKIPDCSYLPAQITNKKTINYKLKSTFYILEKINLIILVFLFSLSIKAQEKNEFFALNYSLAGPAEFKKSNSEMRFSSLDTYLITPTINAGIKIKINNIFSYRFTEYDFSNGKNTTDELKQQLTDAKWSVLFRYNFNERQYLFVLPQIIFRSDLQNKFSSKDFFPAIYAIFYHTSKKNSRLKIGYGLAYSRDYFKNNLTPLLAFSYESERLYFEAILPGNAQLTFLPNPAWEYGVVINLDTAVYKSDSSTNPETEYLRTLNIPLLLNVSRRIDGILWINAKAGVSLIKNYGALDTHFDLIENQNTSLNPSPYFSIGLSMRLNENKK